MKQEASTYIKFDAIATHKVSPSSRFLAIRSQMNWNSSGQEEVSCTASSIWATVHAAPALPLRACVRTSSRSNRCNILVLATSRYLLPGIKRNHCMSSTTSGGRLGFEIGLSTTDEIKDKKEHEKKENEHIQQSQ
jgi:hypothetical protein